MKAIFLGIIMSLMTSSLTGCIRVRQYPVGRAKSLDTSDYKSRKPSPNFPRTEVEVTLPPYLEYYSEDKELTGNRGYIMGGPGGKGGIEKRAGLKVEAIFPPFSGISAMEAEIPTTPSAVREGGDLQTGMSAETQPMVKEAEVQEELYIVKKGESLSDIAARPEIYGDKNKWMKIYNANSARIKNPNRIYPGQKLSIPRK